MPARLQLSRGPPPPRAGDVAFPPPASNSWGDLPRPSRCPRFSSSLQNKAFLKLETSALRCRVEVGDWVSPSIPPPSIVTCWVPLTRLPRSTCPEFPHWWWWGRSLSSPSSAPCPLPSCVGSSLPHLPPRRAERHPAAFAPLPPLSGEWTPAPRAAPVNLAKAGAIFNAGPQLPPGL